MEYVDNYLLGMDCGTTNIKAVLLGEDGKVVAEASRPSEFITGPGGVSEQDPYEWWEEAVDIFRSLAAQTDQTVMQRIRGIAVSSHTVTMLPMDKHGEPVRNAIIYQDQRSVKELQDILEEIGEERFVRIVGGQPSVTFLPSKLLWYRKQEPDNFAKTTHYLQANSYITYRLTGEMVTDLDQATRTQCLDMNTMTWSNEIGKVIGIDLDRCLPRICPVDEVIGRITEVAAKETGLTAGIPVIAGCSDAMASMYAMGLSRLGQVGESAGTSSLVFAGSTEKSALDVPVVTRPCAIKGMPWIFDAPITTTGAAIQWYIDRFAAEEKAYCKEEDKNIYELLNEKALECEPGSGGVMFFPYLLGERAPLWNDYVRAMFMGLEMATTKEDMIRAVFEGTGYALRHVVETLKESGATCDVLRVCGGGAKSRTWLQIKASMLHCPVEVLNDESGDVPVGDALLVGNRLGIFKDLSQAVKEIIKVKEVIEPVKEWEEVYDAMYPYYVKFTQDILEDQKNMRTAMQALKQKNKD